MKFFLINKNHSKTLINHIYSLFHNFFLFTKLINILTFLFFTLKFLEK